MENANNLPPIDFKKIFKTLWAKRKLYYYVLPTVLFGTYLIMVCIPRTYRSSVSLAPESTTNVMNGSIGSLAASFGVGGSFARLQSSDALYAEIYPNIISSNDFIVSLMQTPITTKKGDLKTNYYIYLRDHQKTAWWNWIKGTILEWLKPTPTDNSNGKDGLNVFQLTKRQSEIFEATKGNIKCSVDKKTDIITISVYDQDPLVSATMARATCQKLQDFIINYRTNKARVDYEYYKKLCAESKAKYEKARQLYGSFSDANQDLGLVSFQMKQNDLENDMQLKYNVYSSMSNQLQAAAAKLQEATPSFTIIENASVPIKPAKPKRLFTAIGMMILSFFILTAWVLIKKER